MVDDGGVLALVPVPAFQFVVVAQVVEPPFQMVSFVSVAWTVPAVANNAIAIKATLAPPTDEERRGNKLSLNDRRNLLVEFAKLFRTINR